MVKPRSTLGPEHAGQTRPLATTVALSEVFAADMRVDASAYNILAREIVAGLRNTGITLKPLYGQFGFCAYASNAFRFRRIYVEASHGTALFSSSDIIDLRPEPSGYLSNKLTRKLAALLIDENDVLISCSGTVGNVALAGARMAKAALTQHAIRLRAPDADTAGFIVAFLRSRFGRPQLVTAKYGSVVTHIEPDHLKSVLVPDLHPLHRIEIGRAFVEATRARDKANELIDVAGQELMLRLRLPLFSQFLRRDNRNTVSVFKLENRFDASYHSPLTDEILATIRALPGGVTETGDPLFASEIRPITKFRKRIYVKHGGIPLLSSKQLFQIDPIDVKRLAKAAHIKDMKEIALLENMILVTRSGTIGNVQMTPKYMNGWAGSEHATRIMATNDIAAGYLYAWLSSEYGKQLITRYSYGSVILEIDKEMLSSVLVPLLGTADQAGVARLVLQANGLRNEAWEKEQQGFRRLEEILTLAAHVQPDCGLQS